MDIEKKLKEIGVSANCIATYESVIALSGEKDAKSAAAIAFMISDLIDIATEQKGIEFAKNYIELQAKRLDAFFLADPKAHKEALEGLADLLGVEK
ncbi:MAG: hypothetical protein WC621_00040 [Patescibacteria group bacterium]